MITIRCVRYITANRLLSHNVVHNSRNISGNRFSMKTVLKSFVTGVFPVTVVLVVLRLGVFMSKTYQYLGVQGATMIQTLSHNSHWSKPTFMSPRRSFSAHPGGNRLIFRHFCIVMTLTNLSDAIRAVYMRDFVFQDLPFYSPK